MQSLAQENVQLEQKLSAEKQAAVSEKEALAERLAEARQELDHARVQLGEMAALQAELLKLQVCPRAAAAAAALIIWPLFATFSPLFHLSSRDAPRLRRSGIGCSRTPCAPRPPRATRLRAHCRPSGRRGLRGSGSGTVSARTFRARWVSTRQDVSHRPPTSGRPN